MDRTVLVFRLGLIGLLVGWGIGDETVAVVGLCIGLVAVFCSRVVLWAAAVVPVIVAGTTLLAAPLDDAHVQGFAAERGASHRIGLIMVLVWLAAAWVIWRDSSTNGGVDEERNI